MRIYVVRSAYGDNLGAYVDKDLAAERMPKLGNNFVLDELELCEEKCIGCAVPTRARLSLSMDADVALSAAGSGAMSDPLGPDKGVLAAQRLVRLEIATALGSCKSFKWANLRFVGFALFDDDGNKVEASEAGHYVAEYGSMPPVKLRGH